MLDRDRHIEALLQAHEILSGSASEPEAVAAGAVGLYGLRVLAASAAYYSRTGVVDELGQRWDLLKRETGAVGAALNTLFDAARQTLGVEALRHHPDYRGFQEDGLTRTILVFDKLGATVSKPEGAQVISRAVSLFLARRVRGQAGAATQVTTPGFLSGLGAELLTVDLENRFYAVYDPAYGAGGSMRAVHRRLTTRGIAGSNTFFGQDVNPHAVSIAA